jgi:hypothetical protein
MTWHHRHMTPPVAKRTAPPRTTRITVTDNVIKLVVIVFVVPAPFEITIGIIKKESYDFTRLSIIVGALSVLAIVLAVLRNHQLRVQSIVGYYLLVAGAIVASFGVAVTFRSDLLIGATPWAPIVQTTVGALAPSLGLLLIVSGIYLVRDQARRTRDELEAPAPASIMSPRTIRINDGNASLWKSDLFGEHPGADNVVELCKEYLDVIDLHFVAYYSNEGDCLFYLDCLDDDKMARYDVRETHERRRQYERNGRHVRYLSNKLDKRFLGLDSGVLVRIVLDVKKGALFLYNLEREGFLFGVTLDQRRVDHADRKLSDLANRILIARGGMASQDFAVRLPPE